MRRLHLVIIVVSLLALVGRSSAQAPARNVVVITMDGFRWQEMFTGPGSDYFKKDRNGQPAALEKRYWRDTPE